MSGFFQQLDGSATHKDFLVPFDAHDKVVRASPAVHTKNAKGEPVVPVHEYPKVVGYAEPKDDFSPAEPIVARDAKHEAELAKKKETKA